ncbi:hypothetical protein WA026_007612 [Henosepilachna vigintioctopunctata]|uniref:Uncharacterized protein n=1 Tax=Henosepilachna vigintioctopunctata TaxID=420089 RepID=A0AAW1UNN3_9CUCU
MREYYIENLPKNNKSSLESSSIQYNEGSKQITRKLTITSFFRTVNSGEIVKRELLTYTDTNKLHYIVDLDRRFKVDLSWALLAPLKVRQMRRTPPRVTLGITSILVKNT